MFGAVSLRPLGTVSNKEASGMERHKVGLGADYGGLVVGNIVVLHFL